MVGEVRWGELWEEVTFTEETRRKALGAPTCNPILEAEQVQTLTGEAPMAP